MTKVVIRNLIYTILLPVILLLFGLFAFGSFGGLVFEKILVNLDYSIFSVFLGLIGGFFLGYLSVKVRYRLIKLLIQILIILGISMPVFFVGMWCQYTFAFQLGLFPALRDPTLPSSVLFILTFFLTTRQVRSNYLKPSEEKHILSNSLEIIFNLSIIVSSIFLLELTFGYHGFFELLFNAIIFSDVGLVIACLFILTVLPAIVLFIFNLGFTLYNFISEKSQSKIFTKYLGRSERMIEEGARYTVGSDKKFKDYLFYRLKSPLTIIGLVIVIYIIVVAIFPQVLTPLTLDQLSGVFLGAWDPPSATHLLGQTTFGRDVLGRVAYGISTSIRVCILPVLIGIAIGILFGYLSKVHRWVKGLVLGFMVMVFIIPSMIVILVFLDILGSNISVIMSIMAMYAIPGVTLLISKGNYSLKLTVKKVIAYFPLLMAFNILLFEAIGFLGISGLPIQLGYDVYAARIHLFDAPWAYFFPGMTIYISVMGFLLLHYGLKEPIPIVGRL